MLAACASYGYGQVVAILLFKFRYTVLKKPTYLLQHLADFV